MTSLPLHPAIVHLPLGLAFVMPALAIGFAWALWTGKTTVKAWVAIIALQAVVLGAGVVAKVTGEQEEDRVERIVPHDAIEAHEELADQFVLLAGGTLILAGLVLVFRKPGAARALSLATVVGTLAVGVTAVRVGHAGGRLVYEYNAGAAYLTPGPGAATPGPGLR